MMRKFTATGLAALAFAGIVGTGAAFASSHTAKPPTATASIDRSREGVSADRSSDTQSREHSTADGSRDMHSNDYSIDPHDS